MHVIQGMCTCIYVHMYMRAYMHICVYGRVHTRMMDFYLVRICMRVCV